MPVLIIALLIAAYYFSWWPFDDIERAINNSDFNVYFYYPNEKEKFLRQVNGLPACGSTASNHASSNNISNWSYICCRIDGESSCKSKHR